VEVAGVEPASEDTFPRTSTHIVCLLFSLQQHRQTGFTETIPK